MTFKLSTGNSVSATSRPKIELPTEKIKASRQSPARLLIYSTYKAGKTTALSGLEGCLTLELDPRGADFVDILKIDVQNLKHLEEICDEIVKQGRKYKFVAIDTITILEDWCEKEAVRMYKAHPTGAKFTGDSVLILDYGQGYHWLRMAWDKINRKLETIADYIILVAHLRDREISNGGTALSAKEIALTGKIREITCAKVDAIGFIRRKQDGKNYISFKPKASENIVCSARSKHLTDKDIVLSEFVNGELVVHWNEIFVD
jgi:hypothetical protein